MFIKENLNPSKKRTGDCAVRALAKALNKSWRDMYMELCQEGFSISEMPNSKNTYQNILIKYGFKKVSCPIVKGQKRLNVRLCSLQNSLSICVMSVAGHLVCSVNGNYFDTFDSGNCAVYFYFRR